MSPESALISRIGVPVALHDIDVGGTRLHYAVAGSGPPLLLVHGLNIGWGEWFAAIADLSHAFTVHALDLPGAGGSDKFDFLSGDVGAAFVSAVGNFSSAMGFVGVPVVGHSLGAWVALTLAAARHPAVGAVVAVSPVGFTPHVPWRFRPLAIRAVAKLLATKAVPPTRANLEMFLGDVLIDRSGVVPEYVEYVHAHVTRPPVTHPFLLIHRLVRPFRFREQFLFGRELSAVRSPVLIVHGDGDPLIPLSEAGAGFRRLLPGAKTEIFAGVGHVPPLERPKQFAALVRSWLQERMPEKERQAVREMSLASPA